MSTKGIDEITARINELVIEKTLSGEVFQVLADLRKNYDDLQANLQERKKSIENLIKENSDLRNERDSFLDKQRRFEEATEALNVREKEISTREQAVTLKDLEVKLTNTAKTELFDLMKIVFKNTEVKSSIFGNKTDNSGFYSYNHNESKTIE